MTPDYEFSRNILSIMLLTMWLTIGPPVCSTWVMYHSDDEIIMRYLHDYRQFVVWRVAILCPNRLLIKWLQSGARSVSIDNTPPPCMSVWWIAPVACRPISISVNCFGGNIGIEPRVGDKNTILHFQNQVAYKLYHVVPIRLCLCYLLIGVILTILHHLRTDFHIA